MGSEVKEKALTFDVQGEFITQWTREALYSGEKSFEKIMEKTEGEGKKNGRS